MNLLLLCLSCFWTGYWFAKGPQFETWIGLPAWVFFIVNVLLVYVFGRYVAEERR